MEAALDEKGVLSRKVQEVESSFKRARAEAVEWKTLAKR